MSRTRPIKTQICAASARFNRYRTAPIDRSKMPSSKAPEIKSNPPRKILPYLVAAAIIVMTVYYLPNYFFLEKTTADHAASLLNSLGMQVQERIIGSSVFLANIQIVKECTGVQVIAVFLGLLIPLPNAPLKKKLLTLVVVSTILYAANVLRIALEFWLVYLSILPWYLAHYPLSLLLGIIGVFVLVLVTDRLLPEFGNFLFRAIRLRAG
jgi:exosortase/archaeosortase family protein